MLPVAVAIGPVASDCAVIRYVLPVSWITSYFHTMGYMAHYAYLWLVRA